MPSLRSLLNFIVKQELASRLREHPTIPPSATLPDAQAGELWPRTFCAFRDCAWEDHFGNERSLKQHLFNAHGAELQSVCVHMLRGGQADAFYGVYNQAMAVKCRSQAPLAGESFDRTALKSFSEAMEGNQVEALVCFCCGGIYPYVEEIANKGDIKWYQSLHRCESTGKLLFLNQPLKRIEKLLGLHAYLSKYNLVEGQRVKLTEHESFEDWSLRLPDLEDGVLLCCPEDMHVRSSLYRNIASP